MLPSHHRLRRSADFTAVMRGGQRAARNTVVVHVLTPVVVEPGRSAGAAPESIDVLDRDPAQQPPVPAARFGLVVGRGVGNSVVRHQVSRRLRGLLAQRLDRVPSGTDVVVRARPDAAHADSARLGADLDGALETVSRRLARAGGRAR